MLDFVFALILIGLLIWTKRREGMSQSCANIRQTVDEAGNPIPHCAKKSDNGEDECAPMLDGSCPDPYNVGVCPGSYDYDNGMCIQKKVGNDNGISNVCSPQKDCASCSAVPKEEGNCYWCMGANGGEGGCFDANNPNSCPDYTNSKGGCVRPDCIGTLEKCPK